MKVRTIDGEASLLAQHKLRIIRAQETAAALARKGEVERARRERAKLLKLLNEVDVIEAVKDAGKAA